MSPSYDYSAGYSPYIYTSHDNFHHHASAFTQGHSETEAHEYEYDYLVKSSNRSNSKSKKSKTKPGILQTLVIPVCITVALLAVVGAAITWRESSVFLPGGNNKKTTLKAKSTTGQRGNSKGDEVNDSSSTTQTGLFPSTTLTRLSTNLDSPTKTSTESNINERLDALRKNFASESEQNHQAKLKKLVQEEVDERERVAREREAANKNNAAIHKRVTRMIYNNCNRAKAGIFGGKGTKNRVKPRKSTEHKEGDYVAVKPEVGKEPTDAVGEPKTEDAEISSLQAEHGDDQKKEKKKDRWVAKGWLVLLLLIVLLSGLAIGAEHLYRDQAQGQAHVGVLAAIIFFLVLLEVGFLWWMWQYLGVKAFVLGFILYVVVLFIIFLVGTPYKYLKGLGVNALSIKTIKSALTAHGVSLE